MNPYLEFVKSIEAGIECAKGMTLAEYRTAESAVAKGNGGTQQGISNDEGSSKVLLFSPHPDDECVTGLLPLRLMREAGRQIINVPITFGSNKERQSRLRLSRF